MHFILRFFPNFYFIYNNNKTLIPKFLGWPWIFNKLIKVGHVYYFPSFYSIQKHTFSLRIGSSGDKSKDWRFGADIGGLSILARCNMAGGQWVWVYSWWGWGRIGLGWVGLGWLTLLLLVWWWVFNGCRISFLFVLFWFFLGAFNVGVT